MKRLVIALILFATAACSSDSPTDTGQNPDPNPDPDPGPAPAAVTVTLQALSFSPADARVAVGGTVTWTNDGSPHTITPVDHTVFAEVENTAGQSGQVLQVTFPTAGTYDYTCEFHSGMDGSITVE